MSWKLVETLPWHEPLDIARAFNGHNMALLYSGISEAFTGQDSYLLLNPLEEISGSDWQQLPPLPPSGAPLPLWVGYLGYGMRDANERGTTSPVALPNFRLVRYATLYHFSHEEKIIRQYRAAENTAHSHASAVKQNQSTPRSGVSSLTSNLTRAEYENIVAKTITEIHDGNFYQANITRKFFGEFTSTPDSFSLFETLASASPAPYSAYIKHNDTAILSSSPECFLSIHEEGIIVTRPIKGSARRSDDATADKAIRGELATSSKNHAENLMIVDLMRNDLARVSEANSVHVVEQSALYSYSTIHHLISTVQAIKLATVSAYDAVRACFPAGSMTGAPKIAAMKWCTAQEKIERGVYSGAIGWFGAGDTCDLSVVIRTLIIENNRFEFQVGGGIVADSTPEDEWRETLTKARGILTALGLSESSIANL